MLPCLHKQFASHASLKSGKGSQQAFGSGLSERHIARNLFGALVWSAQNQSAKNVSINNSRDTRKHSRYHTSRTG
jgi:hypothetical protein